MSLMAFFIVVGVCQLFYGPLSDIVGRKPPIYAGLLIFTIGSIGCALAPSIGVLVAFRVVQAFGACAGMVIPRAIVRDLYTGHDAARLMSLLMLVVSVSPILAPLTGSFIIDGFGWRAVFAVLTVAAVMAFVLTATQLEETRPAHLRGDSSWGSAFKGYLFLLRDMEFTSLTLIGAFGISSFFVYLGGASFVLINYYGLTPQLFSLCFALNAASFFGFSQLTGMLTQKFGLPRVIRGSAIGFALAMTLLAALAAVGLNSLALMMSLLFVGYGFLGLLLPATAVLSLERHGEIAGTASALMGALQMIVGSAIMAIAGLFANGTPKPMILGIACCAIGALAVTLVLQRQSDEAVPASAE
jgi:DHA1 family bicyclomycin/chloramphenicol resistance-like MFS transporter